MTLAEKSEITKKLQDDLKLVVWKKVLVKMSNWHGFLMKTTKYKAIQPLYGMELQRFYKKVKLFKLTPGKHSS